MYGSICKRERTAIIVKNLVLISHFPATGELLCQPGPDTSLLVKWANIDHYHYHYYWALGDRRESTLITGTLFTGTILTGTLFTGTLITLRLASAALGLVKLCKN